MDNYTRTLIGASMALLVLMAGRASGQCATSGGPDLIVGEISGGPNNYGNSAGVYALSFGMTYCNPGSFWLNSFAGTNQHMVMTESLFKLKAGDQYTSIEQLGQSWVFHEFFSLSATFCCTDCVQTDGSHLGVHCSNAHSASIIGTQNVLGPKWQVNAASGVNVFPPANPVIANTAARRLQVRPTDLESTSASVHYFAEVLTVAADDAAAGHSDNNASMREVVMTGISTDWNFGLTGTTTRGKAAISAWKASDPSVMETNVDVAGDGRFIVSSKATNLGDGRWHYEYAVYNMTSDRSCGEFSVPLSPGSQLSNVGFHDVDYHDGDGPGNVDFSGADWRARDEQIALIWATEDFSVNQSANAIRWGTLYNFRFDCDVPPESGQVQLGIFKPGAPAFVSAAAMTPMLPRCPGDFNHDGGVDFFDYLDFVQAFSSQLPSADFNLDGIVDFFDYLDFVDAFQAGC